MAPPPLSWRRDALIMSKMEASLDPGLLPPLGSAAAKSRDGIVCAPVGKDDMDKDESVFGANAEAPNEEVGAVSEWSLCHGEPV